MCPHMGATSFERELKRGSAELLILALLEEQERHGYDLARQRGLWAQFVAGLENITRSLPA